MRYRLRTLLIVLAVGPPALGIAAVSALRTPVLAVLILGWSAAFVLACVEEPPKSTFLRLTFAEWLVIAALFISLTMLAMPVNEAVRE